MSKIGRRGFLAALVALPFVPTPTAQPGVVETGLSVSVSRFGDIGADIGAAINAAWSQTKNKGYTLCVPAGTWPCRTPIRIDTDDRGQSLRLEGAGAPTNSSAWPDFDTYQRASVIDATLLGNAAAIATNASGGHRAAVAIRNLAIVGGGIEIANAGIGSHFENLYISGAPGDGMVFIDVYGARFDGLHASKCGGAGLRFRGCNANSGGTITSRENLGEYAIEWVQGRGNSISHLYLEANQGGGFRWAADVLSLEIGTIYAEDNNHGGQADYEFQFGDLSLSSSTARSCRVGSIFLNRPRSPFARARVGFAVGTGVELGLNSSDIQRVFEFTHDDSRNGPVSLANCDLQNGQIDLTHGRSVLLLNCNGTNVTAVLPPANGVWQKIGCNF